MHTLNFKDRNFPVDFLGTIHALNISMSLSRNRDINETTKIVNQKYFLYNEIGKFTRGVHIGVLKNR